MKKTSLLLVLAILLLFSTGLYTGFKLFEKYTLSKKLVSVEAELVVKQNEVFKLNTANVLQAYNAKVLLDELKMNITDWSRVVSELRSLIPKKSGKPIAVILSYSGGEGNNLSMNVSTNALSSDPYEDMAAFLEAFDNNPNFTDSFIPSVATGFDDEGNEVLSFLFSTTYEASVSENILR